MIDATGNTLFPEGFDPLKVRLVDARLLTIAGLGAEPVVRVTLAP